MLISLDIVQNLDDTIDVSWFFVMTSVQVTKMIRDAQMIDDMSWQRPTIDFSLKKDIKINPLRTLEIFDLLSQEVINAKYLWKNTLGDLPDRPNKINLLEPLYVPYGSIDMRSMRPIVSDKKYSDLFARNLPYSLFLRRQMKWTKHFWKQYKNRIIWWSLVTAILSAFIFWYVWHSVMQGYEKLQWLVYIKDPHDIRMTIRQSRDHFERANFLFAPFSWIPLAPVDSIDRITNGGLALTRWLDIIAQSFPKQTNISSKQVKNTTQLISDAYRAPARDLMLMEKIGIENPTDWFVDHALDIHRANTEIKKAGDIYASIRVTGARTTKIKKIGEMIVRISSIFDWTLENQSMLLNMLWDINPQRYVIFNQNRDEIRANGWFPWSIITFTLYKWNILDYRSDDVYYYDWNLFPYKEIPPPGIALLTDNYGLRDVNYYPDFRKTLEKTNNFIERSGDASITTGLAIHQGMIEDMLAKIWPVSVSGVTIPFDADNFSILMSTLVENKYAKEKTPKDILFRFIEAFVQKIHEKNAYIDILSILEQYWKNWEILFASRNHTIDEFLNTYKKDLPWQCKDGKDKNKTCSPNWIYPIWTSVSGNKSDRYIKRTYEAKTKKINACTYENIITIKTKHTYWNADTKLLEKYFATFGITDAWDQKKMKFIQWRGPNKNFVRLFVPTNAILSWEWQKISVAKDPEATILSFLMETPVGTDRAKTVRYQLEIPNCHAQDTRIKWYRQPWIRTLQYKGNYQ